VQQPLQTAGCIFPVAFKRATEPARLAEKPGVRERCDLASRHFAADQIALDIDVAEPAGGLAKLLQQADRIACLRLARRKPGKHGEQFELGFHAAGGGAQAMDSDLSRPDQAEQYRCLERRDGLAKLLHWMG